MARIVLTALALSAAVLTGQAAKAAAAPFLLGSASQGAGSFFLDVPVDADCPKGDMIQVVAVEVGDQSAKITAVDSGGVNIYQSGGGKWKGPNIAGAFLATTSPEEPTNAGLNAGAVITLTYSKNFVWKGAIAVCVPGLETRSGSADNQAGSSPRSGAGNEISLFPSSRLLSRDEPLFVATVLVGDTADRWTESAGYQTLFTLQNGHTLTLAYQIIDGVDPSNYFAFNSARRIWSASNRSYKTPLH